MLVKNSSTSVRLQIVEFSSSFTNTVNELRRGSHLGSQLFSLFINDSTFDCFFSCLFLSFADDLKLPRCP